MKRDWLLYLVIFSLALNLGTIGTFVYLRYQDRRDAALKKELPPMPLRELWGSLNLEGEQRQALGQLLPQHRQRVGEIRRDLAAKRQELFALINQEGTPWPEIQAKIRTISESQGSLEEEVVRFMVEFQKQLKPEQKAAFRQVLERRLCPPHGGRGRPPGGHGPRGPGLGMGPGMGPGCPPGSPAGGN
ncbi:MAG: hypothetical protein A2Y80_03845 [Deltaproteobacteria bacterium RBG_13_58_19]|nr:MAG: hypothetical protein A2Y80_03845 [Deltaproteobacteria bacterium RBG_13_58_19]